MGKGNRLGQWMRVVDVEVKLIKKTCLSVFTSEFGCCWWFRNPAHQLVDSLPDKSTGFYTSQVQYVFHQEYHQQYLLKTNRKSPWKGNFWRWVKFTIKSLDELGPEIFNIQLIPKMATCKRRYILRTITLGIHVSFGGYYICNPYCTWDILHLPNGFLKQLCLSCRRWASLSTKSCEEHGGGVLSHEDWDVLLEFSINGDRNYVISPQIPHFQGYKHSYWPLTVFMWHPILWSRSLRQANMLKTCLDMYIWLYTYLYMPMSSMTFH